VAARLGWNPWAELRRRDHIVFGLANLPAILGGAVLWQRGDRKALMVDHTKGRRERNEACAHELIHDEHPEWTETQVWDEVARRLLPTEELERLRAFAVDNDLPLEVWQVADVFDVTDRLAERAMRLLLSRRG
jgi:hypothetical protein